MRFWAFDKAWANNYTPETQFKYKNKIKGMKKYIMDFAVLSKTSKKGLGI